MKIEFELHLPHLRTIAKKLGFVAHNRWVESEPGFEEIQALVILRAVLKNPAVHSFGKYGAGRSPVEQAINRAYDDEALADAILKIDQAQAGLLGL